MTSAVTLLAERRMRAARAELDAERQVAALLKARGAPGPRGPQGPQGPKGDKPAHEWQGTRLRFENPDGTWGDAIDLRGPKGSRGDRGGAGGGGAGIGALSDLPLPVLDTDFLVVQRADRLYRVSVLQLKDVFGGEVAPTGEALLTEAGDRLTTEGGDVLAME